VRIRPGPHGIRNQHTVKPGVDNAITRLQRHAVPAADKLGQRFMQLHINRLGIGRGMAERLHNQISGKFRQARSVSSSRVIPPVVSCEPTVVTRGSQYCPGRIPATPQALPTIFCASVKPAAEGAGAFGRRKTSEGARFSDCRALAVRLRPIISGMRPPARTSSSRTSVFRENEVTGRWLWASQIPRDTDRDQSAFPWIARKHPFQGAARRNLPGY
jgi:hypothetical protein